MASWRDGASPEVQADLDALLDPALNSARSHLESRGAFGPFAVVVHTDGSMGMGATAPEPAGVGREPADLLELCRRGLTADRDRYRAAAVVVDVRLDEDVDGHDQAIRVELEHLRGPALTVLLPYSRQRLRRRFVYGTLRAVAGTRHIWA